MQVRGKYFCDTICKHASKTVILARQRGRVKKFQNMRDVIDECSLMSGRLKDQLWKGLPMARSELYFCLKIVLRSLRQAV